MMNTFIVLGHFLAAQENVRLSVLHLEFGGGGMNLVFRKTTLTEARSMCVNSGMYTDINFALVVCMGSVTHKLEMQKEIFPLGCSA